MPVLNDFGDAGYQRVTAQLDAFAARLGIPREIIRQYWSDTAHLPQTLDELKAWGMKPDREYGQVRYDQATGQWHPLGTGPTPGKTDQERGGFPHFITNNVSDAQRFQQVDAQGNIFGGSWDPAYNAAHPELAGRPAAALGDDPNARQHAMGQAFTPGQDYVAPSGNGFVSVVGGQSNYFGTQAEAENDFNQRTGGGSPQGAPSAGPGAGAAGPGSAGPAASPAGTTPGTLFNPSAASAANAAVLAFLEQRRIDEIEKPELALKTEVERAQMRRDDALAVWKQAYERASLTGTIDGQPTIRAGELTGSINGTPTLEATKQGADLTGFTGPGYAAQAQAAFERLPPEQRTPEMAATIWRNVAPGLSPQEAAQLAQAGHDYYAATGQVMPDAVAGQTLARITGGRITGTGAQATPAYQHQQNQDAISALTLLSNLRGPENAFAYANTLASLPDSVRNTIGAAVSNLGLTPRNPAQAGLLNDVTGGQPVPQLPIATGPRTTAPTSGVGPAPAIPAGAPRIMPGTMNVHDAIGQGAPSSATYPSGEPRQQIQGGMRMDPATQAAIAAGGGVQRSGPALVAAPGVGVPAPVLDARMPSPYQHSGPALVAQPGIGGANGGLPMQHSGPAMVAAPGVAGQPAAVGNPVQHSGPYLRYQGPLAPAYGPRTQPQPLPSFAQTSPTDWQRTNVYARQLALAGYENAGQDKNAILDEYRMRLPRATGPRVGRLAS